MRIPRLYLPLPLTPGANVALDERCFNHAVRVLRLTVPAPLILFNGHGHAYRACLSAVHKREAWAQVLEALPAQQPPSLHITLALGMSRGEKMDYALQKAVELGANVLQPISTERAALEVQGERLQRRLQHWQGIVIAACEQCGRNVLPTLCPPLPLSTLLQQAQHGMRLILDPSATTSLRSLPDPHPALTVLVGAEGGFTAEEVAAAQAAGCVGVRFGPRILRTETASVAVLAAVQVLWGDGG